VKFDCFFYYVSDLDRSIRFFSDVLGLSLSSRDDVARFLIDGILFELVPTSDSSQLSGSGNGRLTFEVPDISKQIYCLVSGLIFGLVFSAPLFLWAFRASKSGAATSTS
jgi:catechol 2,3-dioxygenase-like lactoylglutathione lyase family enzyme